ncbi:GerMN domain-containing protein [Niameybacter massiliensis]|uniref:GerMN domain-containing protein n=1 Tax=Holtiella tumoricola TaxID=3018743 RepID=A0AA42DKH1_9FIRM|nr:GerMN domain-containing protein [Holtiella tumoricola]MDA3730716.1 GerMN domain-containing protein [Holtiella tumoricola]
MQLKKRVVIPVLCAVLVIGLGFNYVKKQEPNDILVEEEIADLPQKPSVSLDTYLPVIKDTIWTYESNEKYRPLSSWVEFINNDVMQIKFLYGDKSITKVYVEEEDAIYEVASVEDVAIKENYTTLRQYKNTVLKLPLTAGNSWVLSDGAIRTITKVDKKYDTPLGEQKGIEVTTLHDDYKITEVYGEKVGLIYAKYENDNGVQEFELNQIENNKAQEETVSLYIAKKETGALELIKEKVAIMTNEEPKHFLTDLLKKVMDSEYVTTLSNGVTIEKTFKDDENCLYVELSGEFVDLNYNAREQKGVLASLVQTLGRYYDADYVVINIEGEAYPVKGGQADSRGRIRVVK